MRRLVFRRTISHKYNKQILTCCLSLRISSTMPLLHTCQLSRFPGSLLVGHQISQSPTLRAESLSIFIDKSGRGKKTVLTACTFHIEHALTVISINTQVIIQNRALALARYLGLSADNHLDGQNGCQQSFCHCK